MCLTKKERQGCLSVCGVESVTRWLACCLLLSSLVFCKENTDDIKQESAILPVHSPSASAELEMNAVNYLLVADEYLRQMLEDQKQQLTSLSLAEVHTKRATSAPFSGGIYGKRASLPFSGGVYGKRANLPFYGGVYGKPSSLPFSGGLYGKRANTMVGDLSVEDPTLLDRVSIRAMPINGGMYGRK